MATDEFSKHELLDRTHLISDTFQRFVMDHPALDEHPELKKRVEMIADQMESLYQAFGAEFLGDGDRASG